VVVGKKRTPKNNRRQITKLNIRLKTGKKEEARPDLNTVTVNKKEKRKKSGPRPCDRTVKDCRRGRRKKNERCSALSLGINRAKGGRSDRPAHHLAGKSPMPRPKKEGGKTSWNLVVEIRTRRKKKGLSDKSGLPQGGKRKGKKNRASIYRDKSQPKEKRTG